MLHLVVMRHQAVAVQRIWSGVEGVAVVRVQERGGGRGGTGRVAPITSTCSVTAFHHNSVVRPKISLNCMLYLDSVASPTRVSVLVSITALRSNLGLPSIAPEDHSVSCNRLVGRFMGWLSSYLQRRLGWGTDR